MRSLKEERQVRDRVKSNSLKREKEREGEREPIHRWSSEVHCNRMLLASYFLRIPMFRVFCLSQSVCSSERNNGTISFVVLLNSLSPSFSLHECLSFLVLFTLAKRRERKRCDVFSMCTLIYSFRMPQIKLFFAFFSLPSISPHTKFFSYSWCSVKGTSKYSSHCSPHSSSLNSLRQTTLSLSFSLWTSAMTSYESQCAFMICNTFPLP